MQAAPALSEAPPRLRQALLDLLAAEALALDEPARDERGGAVQAGDELAQLRLGDDGILVLSQQRLDLLRVVEEAFPLLARSRELGCVARPFELDPESVQLVVGRVLAELLDGVEQAADSLPAMRRSGTASTPSARRGGIRNRASSCR